MLPATTSTVDAAPPVRVSLAIGASRSGWLSSVVVAAAGPAIALVAKRATKSEGKNLRAVARTATACAGWGYRCTSARGVSDEQPHLR